MAIDVRLAQTALSPCGAASELSNERMMEFVWKSATVDRQCFFGASFENMISRKLSVTMKENGGTIDGSWQEMCC